MISAIAEPAAFCPGLWANSGCSLVCLNEAKTVIAKTVTMTTSETGVEISGADLKPFSWAACKISFTPINQRITDKPYDK